MTPVHTTHSPELRAAVAHPFVVTWDDHETESNYADRTPENGVLIDGWRASTATWNVVPQRVNFSRRRLDLNADPRLSMDAWGGCPASRDRVLDGAYAPVTTTASFVTEAGNPGLQSV
jgi:phosphodiesterase/alkaline phosphatase D-like protein